MHLRCSIRSFRNIDELRHARIEARRLEAIRRTEEMPDQNKHKDTAERREFVAGALKLKVRFLARDLNLFDIIFGRTNIC